MNGVFVDSSVVLDIFTDDPLFYSRSLECLAAWGAKGDLLINDLVYAEVSVGFLRIEELERALLGAQFLRVPMPSEALFLAGKAFINYRLRGGAKTAPLPDFFIGAHAAVVGLPLITRDPTRVRDAFPSLKIIIP